MSSRYPSTFSVLWEAAHGPLKSRWGSNPASHECACPGKALDLAASRFPAGSRHLPCGMRAPESLPRMLGPGPRAQHASQGASRLHPPSPRGSASTPQPKRSIPRPRLGPPPRPAVEGPSHGPHGARVGSFGVSSLHPVRRLVLLVLSPERQPRFILLAATTPHHPAPACVAAGGKRLTRPLAPGRPCCGQSIPE